MWQSQDVSHYGEGFKQLFIVEEGLIDLEYSTFTVEGKPGLSLVVFNPACGVDRDKLARLMARKSA